MSADLRLWLRRVGLEQHAAIFAANDVDLQVLPDLSDEDLKALGLSLGHRRKLLRAIAERSNEQSQPATEPVPSSNAAIASGEPARRQVTVLFCDLVGSTELSGRLDPEDLRELLGRYHETITAVVVRHGGYVANYLGDGILAYFGWPQAEEDEAAQAIRAGLAAVAAAKELSLQVHVGIASGTVVVGGLDRAGRRQAGAIAGETPNLAARLEALAGPDQVVIGGLTRRLIGAAFVLDDLGPQHLKGIVEPVQAWQVLAERAVEFRFDAREGRLSRFVGRTHEVALLVDRFERAAAGEGQAILLSGEAGIGKSRVVRQLHERLVETSYTRLRLQCSPSHTDSALHPIIRHLEHSAGFRPDDGPEKRLDKLEALLRHSTEDVTESAACLASLLSLPAADRYGAIELTAEQRVKRTFKTLIDHLLGLAAKEPVLYILEDAHWLDPTTKELVMQTLNGIGDARVLMLITHRPDFRSDWARYPHVTTLTLSRLSRGEGEEMVRAAGGEALSKEIVARILRRADGVPFYIEELTRAVIETENSRADNIPETLQASLLARLDRLGTDAKEVAQMAAVIGREFSGAVLEAVAGKAKDEIDRALRGLITSEIVLPAGAPEGDYTFRHALIQDAAYQSLLLSRRRQYHGEIASALERRFPEMVESHPELVAQHYTAADAPQQAIPYWLQAGKRALARYAIVEPIAHFERGLELARRLPEEAMRSRLILDLLLVLGDAQFRSGRHQASLEAFREAADFARQLQSVTDLAEAAVGVERTERYIDGPERASLGLLEAALCALGDSETLERCRVLSHLGRALFSSHFPERATTLLRDASNLARRLGDRHALLEALISERITVAGRPYTKRQFSENRAALQEMLAIAEEIGDPHQIGHVLANAIPTSLEMADRAAFDAMFARYTGRYGEMLKEHPMIPENYPFISCSAMRAILHGEFAEAESLAEKALEVGRHLLHGDVATGVYGVQMFTIRREQGRLAEVAAVLQRFLDQNPQDMAWRPGLALIASDLGFKDAARKAFENLALAGFSFPKDAKWSLTISYLAEVCASLGDIPRAGQLYDLLLPYRDITILASPTVCCGSAARYLGMLASVVGNWPMAEEHFVAAMAIDAQLKAWPWLAHTQYEFALALATRESPECRARGDALLAAAAETAQRLGMTALQQKIRLHLH